MKLKEFNQRDCATHSSTPKIRINVNGAFSINRVGAENLKLKEGDKIKLYQDEDSPRDWYLRKTDEADGIKLRAYKKGSVYSTGLMFQSVYLARRLLVSSGIDNSKSMSFLLASKPVEDNYYAIITRSGKL